MPQADEFRQYLIDQGYRTSDVDSMISNDPDFSEPDVIPTAPVENSLTVATPEFTKPAKISETPVMPSQPLVASEPQMGVKEMPLPDGTMVKVAPAVTQPSPRQDKQINQPFGNPNPKLYGYSNGRANIYRGVDLSAEAGEPQFAPSPGKWIVQTAYNGNGFNTGWGRSVVIRNSETGETIRRSHFDKVLVRPGQDVTGKPLGTTGRSGRTTGYHEDVEYTNPNGQLADYTRSPYY